MIGSGQEQSCLICSYRDSESVRKPGSMSMEHTPPCRSVAHRVTLGQDKPPLPLLPLCVMRCVGLMPDKLPPRLTTLESDAKRRTKIYTYTAIFLLPSKYGALHHCPVC